MGPGPTAMGGPVPEGGGAAPRGRRIIESVPPRAAVVGIIGRVGCRHYMVVASAAIDRVAACSVREYVAAVVPRQTVVTGARGHHVVPGISRETIIATTAIERVVAGIAVMGIAGGSGQQNVHARTVRD